MIRWAFVSLIIIFASVHASESFWPGKTLSAQKVAKRWGKQELDPEKFKTGDLSARASMSYSLIVNQAKFVGKSLSEIKKLFGDHDGHYFNDWTPAYLIQEGERKGEDTWQLVFLPDKERKVSKIIVHKNCCD